jgi:hypothetical protein
MMLEMRPGAGEEAVLGGVVDQNGGEGCSEGGGAAGGES